MCMYTHAHISLYLHIGISIHVNYITTYVYVCISFCHGTKVVRLLSQAHDLPLEVLSWKKLAPTAPGIMLHQLAFLVDVLSSSQEWA